ncbi:putative P-loop containing nucleoside triphosphate hydrolase [Helianthus annuus]|uniref:P-loop containing nucleoside triphosphate hydrolase n=1 Tax=Helianthus annuus TaxID=4232 RepID=A0A9K3I342_HELAN|nr:putative P-loop containing nucleoside triphosphate hydrolase [Helianthus annuus]
MCNTCGGKTVIIQEKYQNLKIINLNYYHYQLLPCTLSLSLSLFPLCSLSLYIPSPSSLTSIVSPPTRSLMQQMLTSSNSYPPVLHLNRALGRQVQPKTLEKVLVHQVIAQNFKKLVTEQDCPHLLFYVPPGSGKKTLIMALLWQMFGASADKVKVENKNWKVDDY